MADKRTLKDLENWLRKEPIFVTAETRNEQKRRNFPRLCAPMLIGVQRLSGFGAVSSLGRAPRLHRGGGEFESPTVHRERSPALRDCSFPPSLSTRLLGTIRSRLVPRFQEGAVLVTARTLKSEENIGTRLILALGFRYYSYTPLAAKIGGLKIVLNSLFFA